MLSVLRHLLSILLLPFLVVVLVPAWLIGAFAPGGEAGWSANPLSLWLIRTAGLLVLVLGLGLFGWCVGLFARVGQGTLAPWDPTRKLVASGPYRFVRNPMISSVACLLVGQALLRVSLIVGLWALAFICINHVYFILSEEPGLEARFGEPYRQYKASVPRWLPRLWPGEKNKGG